jgi:hypothetical protein
MNYQEHPIIKLAADNLHVGVLLIGTCAAYSEEIRAYRGSALKAVQSVLEALSGIFCELARQQAADEPTANLCFQSEASHDVILSVLQYFKTCSGILETSTDPKSNALPFTAMYLRAQTLMNAVREACDGVSPTIKTF